MFIIMTPLCLMFSVIGISEICEMNLSENITICAISCITLIIIINLVILYLLDRKFN